MQSLSSLEHDMEDWFEDETSVKNIFKYLPSDFPVPDKIEVKTPLKFEIRRNEEDCYKFDLTISNEYKSVKLKEYYDKDFGRFSPIIMELIRICSAVLYHFNFGANEIKKKKLQGAKDVFKS